MSATWFLQRLLPFSLTLALGALLGGAANLFNWRSAPHAGWRERSYHRGGGCRKRSGRRAYAGRTTPVVFTHEPSTRYTKEAAENGTTGVVRLRVTFGASGRVEAVEPVLRLPHGLTEEAERAAWQTKFVPATRGGEPVDATKEVEYFFTPDHRGATGL